MVSHPTPGRAPQLAECHQTHRFGPKNCEFGDTRCREAPSLPFVDYSWIDITADLWQDPVARPILLKATLIVASVDMVSVGLLVIGGVRMLHRAATTP